MALAGKRAQVLVTGAPVSFSGEETESIDGQTYKIKDESMVLWDRTADINIFIDEDPAQEGYKLNRLRGTVIFDAQNPGRGDVTVSGKFLPKSLAGGCFEYSYSITASNILKPEFGMEFMERVQGLKSISGTISRWYDLDNYFLDELFKGEPIVIEFYSSKDKEPDVIAWVIISSDDLDTGVDALVTQAVAFEGTTDIDGKGVESIG